MYNYLKIRVSGQTNPYNGQPRTYRLRYTFFILFSFISSFSLLAQGNSWITKTDMPTSRYSHMTAVVNGKIYAIGGVTTGSGCSTPAIQTVEEYNPLTNTWNTTKTDMPTARESFALSAVNGKIYSLGGSTITCTNQLKTVEEYDPDTDTWATTKTGMPTARAALSTSVVNGKIYAIGGYDHDLDEYLANVEEYDPITDEWVTKTPMPDARAWFSTCVVAGKIYAFGGYYDNPEDSTIYVYDPGTDTWDSTAAPFATGSCITDTLNGMIYIFGGRHLAEDRALADVWRYNPNNDIWDLMSPIPVALAGGPSSVVNGKIYIIGGSTTLWPSQPSSTVFEFTPPWTTKLNMPTPRHSLGTGVVNGKIYAIGGVTSSNGCDSPASSKVEAYDPDTDTWDTTKTPMPMERESFAISVVNDKIFVMGGSPVSCENHTSTVQEYNPQTDTWDTNKSSMPTPRTGLSTSVVNGKIYAIGGYTYDPYLPVSKVEEYDPNTDKWTEKEPMLTARGWFTTCVLDNKIFAFGGWNGEALGTVDVYDPVTNVWIQKNDMSVPLTGHSAHTVGNRIYIFGGVSDFYENGPVPVSDVWQYNATYDSWISASPMLTARTAGHASVVSDTVVYVIGGSTTNHPLQPVATTETYTPQYDLLTPIEDIFKSKKIPTRLVLDQNFPNPFNPVTAIGYQLLTVSDVELSIYNILGQKVATLVNERQHAGHHQVEWNASGFASGVYYYKIEAGEFAEMRKMILLR